jgi:hypothetical protein
MKDSFNFFISEVCVRLFMRVIGGEMTLNTDLDATVDNTQHCEGIWEKAVEI